MKRNESINLRMLFRTIKLLSAICLVLCSSNFSYASRPLITEDDGVAGNGIFQMEIGTDYTVQNNNDKNYSIVFVPIYGIVENTEISLELPYKFIRTNDGNNTEGISDINLVSKTLLIPKGNINPVFLLKTQVKLSNGSREKGLGSGDEDIGFIGVFGKAFGTFTIHSNFGYVFVGKKIDNTINNYILYSISCEYLLNEKFKLVGEIYQDSDFHYDIGSFEHHTLNPLIGMNYQLNGKINIDIAYRIGIVHGKKSVDGIITGMSFYF